MCQPLLFRRWSGVSETREVACGGAARPRLTSHCSRILPKVTVYQSSGDVIRSKRLVRARGTSTAQCSCEWL